MTRREHSPSPGDSAIMAFDDPVPTGSEIGTAVVAPERCPTSPHRIECEVQHRLASLPGIQILALTVHRMEDGVCLEGTLETDRPCPNLQEVLQEINGIEQVVNRLRVHHVDRLSGPVSAEDETAWV